MARTEPALTSTAAALWPDGVAFSEAVTDATVPGLWPVEAAFVARAAPRRVAEFAFGRACARAALGSLGIPPSAIAAGADRAPVWPEGIRGSISHTDGYAAAAVARDRDFLGIGLDAEPAGRVARKLWPKIATVTEQAWLLGLGADLEAQAATLLFCAKEAFYKCQYPATGRWLGFADVEVEAKFIGVAGTYTVRVVGALARGDAMDSASGRYLVRDDGLLLASAWIARAAADDAGRADGGTRTSSAAT